MSTATFDERLRAVRRRREIEQNITYWTMKKAQATRPCDRTHAGARLMAWKLQRAAL